MSKNFEILFTVISHFFLNHFFFSLSFPAVKEGGTEGREEGVKECFWEGREGGREGIDVTVS